MRNSSAKKINAASVAKHKHGIKHQAVPHNGDSSNRCDSKNRQDTKACDRRRTGT
jgi:hypothetical protein